ncbi:MAG: hypothetical protein ACPGVT_01895 [Maricaulaceae bacterium]
MTHKIKNMALMGSALAAIAALSIPVSASHSNGLRGMFNANQMSQPWGQGQGQYTHNNSYAENQNYNNDYYNSQHHGNEDPALYPYEYINTQGQSQYASNDYPQQYVEQPCKKAGGLRGLFGSKKSCQPVSYDPQAAYQFNTDLNRSYNLGGATVRTNTSHTNRMLDWQENQTGKTISLLANRASGILQDNSLYIGGGIKGGLMWQQTSDAGKFPLLSRFPFFSNQTDKQTGVFAINNAAFAFTSTYGDWTTIYMQPEYSETEYGRDQDEFQLRKAYIVFGNLKKSPFYAAFGRKDVDFGNFDSYNAFTHNEAAHYFLAHSDQPVLELGFYKNGFKLTTSAMSAGRQLRVAYAGEENNIGNYAASIEKEFQFGKKSAFTIGGGYLHDSIYRTNWTAHTFQAINRGTPPANLIEYRNSVVNGFAEYNSPLLDLMVEYTTTLEPWAAAIPQDANGNVDPAYLDANGDITFDQNLEVLVAQARLKPMVGGKRLAIAATGSWGKIGDDFVGMPMGPMGPQTTWKNNQQHAASLEYPITPYLDIGAEYVYNKGFIPFVAPQIVSDDSVKAHAVNIGFKARF